MDNLQAEVHLREQEQMRADLGSNCNSEIGHQHDALMYVNQLKDMDGYSSRRNVTNWLNDYKSDNCLPENQLPNKKPSAIHATHADKMPFREFIPKKRSATAKNRLMPPCFVALCLKIECLLQSKWSSMETPELS